MRPNPLFIMPDDAMSGRTVVETVTSEAGPFAGPVTIGTGNDGDLLPNTYAHEVTQDYALDFGLSRAGGPYRTAEWRWKNSSDSATSWRGVDQIGWVSNSHDPFASQGGYRNVQTACFARRLNIIFLYWATGSGTILVRYRSAGGDPTSWTLASVTLTRPIVTILAGGISVFELPDGTLRMLIVSGHEGVADNDVDVYSSTDGLTWTLASRNVISQSGIGALLIQNIKAAQSGDWIRLLVFTVGTTYSLVSSDRGASFGSLTNFTTAIPTNTQTADPYSLCDLVGLDDYAGTFLMFFNDRTGGFDAVQLSVASRDQDFAVPSPWSAFSTDAAVYRVCAGKTSTHVVVYLVEWAGTANDAQLIGCLFCERNVAGNADPTDWAHFIMATCLRSNQSNPRSLASCEVDSGLLLMFGRCGPGAVGAEAEYGGLFYVQQWSARPMWQDEKVTGAATEPWAVWDSVLGDITDWAATSWVNSTGAAASRTWLPDYTRLQSTAAGATGVVRSSFLPGSSARWANGANTVCEWVVKQPSLGGAGSDDRTAVRIKGIGTTAAVSVDFSVRHLSTDVVLYDNATALPIATMSGLSLASYFYVGRAAITVHDSATWAEVAFARVDQMGSAWSFATGTLSTAAAGVTMQMVNWGHLTGVSGVSSDWRRFAFAYLNDWHQAGFVNPGSLRGAPVSARPWYVSAGVWVDWSGGAGFEFDTWQAESRHRNEVDNLFLPSPQATWRSTSLASNQIILDSTNVPRAFFAHDAVSFFGCNVRKLKVAYNTANSWAAPATQHTLYSDLVSGLTLSAVSPSVSIGYVDVVGATLDENTYAGKWLHATNGPWSGASVTITSQIGNRLFFDAPGWTTNPMATGNSVVIHGSVLSTLFSARQQYRYMLIETAGQTTAAGYYEVGLPVCGVTMGLDGAAMDWQHTESTLNGVEVTDGLGGVRWGFEVTPPRRRWEGVVAGDASKVRRTFERTLKAFASLSVKPFALVWDRDQQPHSVAPVRYVGDVEFANDGWRQASDGTWYAVGNADVRFEEEL